MLVALAGRTWPRASGAALDRLAFAAAVFGVLILGWAAVTWMAHPTGLGFDIRAYYDAALRLAETGSPYQSETLSGPFRPGPLGLYLYAPPLAVFFAPLAQIPVEGAAALWLLVRMLLLGLTIALMPVSRRIRLFTFAVAACSAPILSDLNLGNVSLIVTFAAVVAWRWLDRPLGAIAVGAALMLRPTMALVLAWWLLRGLWRPIAWGVGAAAVLFLCSLPFVGISGWNEYLVVVRNVANVTGVPRNVDLASALLLLGAPSGAAGLALIVGYGVVLAAVVFSLRRDRELSYVVTVMATLLLSPLLWNHYLALLIIPAAFLASRGHAWALALPLLCWLPLPTTPFLALAGLLLPFVAPDRGEPAGLVLDRTSRREPRRPAPA